MRLIIRRKVITNVDMIMKDREMFMTKKIRIAETFFSLVEIYFIFKVGH